MEGCPEADPCSCTSLLLHLAHTYPPGDRLPQGSFLGCGTFGVQNWCPGLGYGSPLSWLCLGWGRCSLGSCPGFSLAGCSPALPCIQGPGMPCCQRGGLGSHHGASHCHGPRHSSGWKQGNPGCLRLGRMAASGSGLPPYGVSSPSDIRETQTTHTYGTMSLNNTDAKLAFNFSSVPSMVGLPFTKISILC